jgi:hypothetical protein
MFKAVEAVAEIPTDPGGGRSSIAGSGRPRGSGSIGARCRKRAVKRP